jgi:hypothetical protein
MLHTFEEGKKRMKVIPFLSQLIGLKISEISVELVKQIAFNLFMISQLQEVIIL